MPTLSIITINHNNAPGLKRTMESVINQTSMDFEYIIIDGSSCDDSVNVIMSFTDITPGIYSPSQNQPITYWISEPDTGIYNAMNKGIKVAKGEYCQFLNSGDYLVTSSVIERMLKENPQCDIYYGNLIKCTGKKYFRDKGFAGKNPTMLSFFTGTLNHSSTYIKRELFEKYGGYNEKNEIVSDWEYFLKVIVFGEAKIAYNDIDIVVFDMNGLSSINKSILKEERKKVLEELIPMNILRDYEEYWFELRQLQRISKYKLTKKLFYFFERVIFKFEKLLKMNKINYFKSQS